MEAGIMACLASTPRIAYARDGGSIGEAYNQHYLFSAVEAIALWAAARGKAPSRAR